MPRSVFALIVCPLKEEWNSVVDRCFDLETVSKGTALAKLSSLNQTFDVVICTPMEKGSVASAVVTANALHRFDPKYIFLVGICGGLSRDSKSALEFGDVVFSSAVIRVENSKILDRPDPKAFDVSFSVSVINSELVSAFKHYRSRLKRREIRSNLEVAQVASQSPRIEIGTSASVDSVIKSLRYGNKILNMVRSEIRSMTPVSVEMEFSGVEMAARQAGIDDRLMMVRGVNDMADDFKMHDQTHSRSSARQNASFVATDFLKYLWENDPIQDVRL